MAAGIEPATCALSRRRSGQLSYATIELEEDAGIEPASRQCHALALPTRGLSSRPIFQIGRPSRPIGLAGQSALLARSTSPAAIVGGAPSIASHRAEWLFPRLFCGLRCWDRSRKWSERRGSNSRPLDPKSSALPGCATFRELVAGDGIEPSSHRRMKPSGLPSDFPRSNRTTENGGGGRIRTFECRDQNPVSWPLDDAPLKPAFMRFGVDARNRTEDHRIHIPGLCQLSYDHPETHVYISGSAPQDRTELTSG